MDQVENFARSVVYALIEIAKVGLRKLDKEFEGKELTRRTHES